MTEREKIGKEIFTWIDKDPMYTLVLIPYAVSIGAITPDEGSACKKDLEEYYEKNKVEKTHKDKVFMVIFPILGFSKSKVLYNLITQLPDYVVDGTTLRINEDHILKQFDNMSTHAFYRIMNELESDGYITKGKNKGKKVYTINFNAIEDTYNKRKETDNG